MMSNRFAAYKWGSPLALSLLLMLFSSGAFSETPQPMLSSAHNSISSNSTEPVNVKSSQRSQPGKKNAGSPPLGAHIPNAYELGLAKPYDASQPVSAPASSPAALTNGLANSTSQPLSYRANESASSGVGSVNGVNGVNASANAPVTYQVTPVTHVVVPGPELNAPNSLQNQTLSSNQARSTDPLMAIAAQIQTGHFPCELGQTIDLREVPGEMTHYTLTLKGRAYAMVPMVSQTGAIMLEDPKAGLKWIQLPNKSMLLSSKLGQRLADECQSPSQVQEAKNLKLHPPQHLLAPKGETQYTINVVN